MRAGAGRRIPFLRPCNILRCAGRTHGLRGCGRQLRLRLRLRAVRAGEEVLPDWAGLQAVREGCLVSTETGTNSAMEEVKPEGLHLRPGLRFRPALLGHAIRGNLHSGAVVPGL